MLLAPRHLIIVVVLAFAVAAISFTARAGKQEKSTLKLVQHKLEQMEVAIAALKKRVDSLEHYMHFSEKTDVTLMRQEQKEKKGLRVVTRPSAEIYINGKYVGDSPYENYQLKPGSYTVRIKHPDFDPIDEVVQIREREVQTIEISFR